MSTARAAWREPMLWLVMIIPLATLVGGWLTLQVAMAPGLSDSAPDEVRRTAQVQHVDLAPDLQAARLGLRFEVRIDGVTGRIHARKSAGAPLATGPMRLLLVHPLREQLDRRVELVATTDGWQAQADVSAAVRWRMAMQPADGRWRVVARWPDSAGAVQMLSSLTPE